MNREIYTPYVEAVDILL